MTLPSFATKHKWLLLILLFSTFFLFSNLGDRNIGVDETWTVIFSENILEHGYPLVTKTYNFFPENFVPTFDSWLSYYIVAGSYALFGVNNFASRLPFALFGLATIAFLYCFTLYYTKKKPIALLATFLLASSYLFYIHARQSRYFSMIMFLVLLLIYAYLKLIDSANKKYAALFIIVNILFFYTQIQLWAYTVLGIALHYLLFRFNKRTFKRLALSSSIAFVFCLPWLYLWLFVFDSLSSGHTSKNLFTLFFNIAVGTYYYLLIVFPLTILALALLIKKIRTEVLFNKQYFLFYSLIIVFLIFISIIGLNPLPEPRKIVSTLLPLSCILLAHIFYLLYKQTPKIATLLIALLIFTNILFVLPLSPLKILNLEENIQYSETHYGGFVDRSLAMRYNFYDLTLEITTPYSSIHDKIFDQLDTLQLNNQPIRILTDLDHNQLNYQSIKRGHLVEFDYLPEHTDDLSSYSYYIINFETNLDLIDQSMSEAYIINDYQETAWIDSTNPIYRRYGTSTEQTMTLFVPKQI